MSQTLHELALSGNNLAVPYKSSSGSGGSAVWMSTPQTELAQERDFSAHGYNALRLAPAQFQSSYLGGLVRGGLLRSDFGGLRVDFKA